MLLLIKKIILGIYFKSIQILTTKLALGIKGIQMVIFRNNWSGFTISLNYILNVSSIMYIVINYEKRTKFFKPEQL